MKRLLSFVAILSLGFGHVRGADDLPKALLIGDSISQGYTQPVIDLLRGKIAVSRPQANCSSTEVGLANLDKWLEGGPWQVIHFNWGLHDLWQHNQPNINGKRSVPLPQYEKNLEALVLRLKATGASLVFATTTRVPEGGAGRIAGDDVKYNAAALAIMKKHGVAIDDLHALTKTFPPELFTAPGNVHFKPEGSQKLAALLAESIAAALKKP